MQSDSLFFLLIDPCSKKYAQLSLKKEKEKEDISGESETIIINDLLMIGSYEWRNTKSMTFSGQPCMR